MQGDGPKEAAQPPDEDDHNGVHDFTLARSAIIASAIS